MRKFYVNSRSFSALRHSIILVLPHVELIAFQGLVIVVVYEIKKCRHVTAETLFYCNVVYTCLLLTSIKSRRSKIEGTVISKNVHWPHGPPTDLLYQQRLTKKCAHPRNLKKSPGKPQDQVDMPGVSDADFPSIETGFCANHKHRLWVCFVHSTCTSSTE